MKLYILINDENGKYYIGVTDNIERRLDEHNGVNNHYTGRNQGEWKLLFNKEYSTKKEALKEEKRLKKAKNKQYIQWYINNQGP